MSARHVLALVALAAAGSARAQADLNVITSVGVKDEGATVVLEVKGSKPPNFTTFSMADPPRFVIDLSEAKFQGVAEDMPVNDGTIIVVKNLSYGSDATSIARVMVAFAADVEPPDVQAAGTSLVVRIAKPAAGGAVARADDSAQRARDEAETKARVEAEAQAAAEAERRAREEQETQAKAAYAASQAQALAKADADRKAREEAEAKARAEVEAELRAEAERAQQGEAARVAEQAQTAAAAVAPTATAATAADAVRAEEEARAAREKAEADTRDRALALAGAEDEKKAAETARKEELRKAKEDYERQRQEAIAAAKDEAERRRIEAEQKREEQRRAAAEAKLAREQEKQRKAEEARAAKEAEKQKREEARLARAEEQKRKTEEARAAKEAEKARREEEKQARLAAREEAKRAKDAEGQLAAGAPSSQLREIGFRQMPGVSRVFVRTSAAPQFTIQDVGENTVRVEFQNTKVARRNDTRFLDTSFFPSAVAMITPSRRGSSYVVDIKLKQRVPYQQKLEGDMLAIDFERPGAPAEPASPAPGGAAAAAAAAVDSALEAEPAPAEGEPKN